MEEEQEPKGEEVGEEEDGETPRVGPVEVTHVGGGRHPPRRKTWISRDSTLNVRTCCRRSSMETSCITTIGRTRTGESQTILHGSVAGSSLLCNQQAGTPRPLEP